MINASIVLYKNYFSEVAELVKGMLEEDIIKTLYIIDNSPTDILRPLFTGKDKLIYIYVDKNVGYGAGHNIAIRKSLEDTKYHLVVNPDIGLEPGVIGRLYNFMERYTDIGQVMPKIKDHQGRVQYLCKLIPSPTDLFFKRFFGKRFNEISANKFQLKFTGYDKQMDVPYLSGCFMFLRCAALKEVGIFDERFFMYPEDIDLTRRIHAKYRTVYYPDVTIIHAHGAASYKSYKMLYIHMINMAKYFNKWGWIFDRQRRDINNKILKELNYNG